MNAKFITTEIAENAVLPRMKIKWTQREYKNLIRGLCFISVHLIYIGGKIPAFPSAISPSSAVKIPA